MSWSDITIKLQTINRCNAYCVVCPYTKTRALEPEVIMNQYIWNKILDELASINFDGWVSFCVQMEPLMDPYLFKRIRDLKEKTRAKISIMTNGSLLTSSNINEFISLDIDLVYLSLLSLKKHNYERWTGLDYNTTLGRIRYLKGLDTNTMYKVIIAGPDYKENVRDLYKIFPDYMQDIDYWIISPDSRAGIMENQQAIKGKGCLVTHDKRYNCCTQPFISLTIMADGTQQLCDIDWIKASIIGNIKDTTLIDMFENMQIYRDQFNNNVYLKETCKRCTKEYDFR